MGKLVFTVHTSGVTARVAANRFVLREDGSCDFYEGRKQVGHFKDGYWTRIYVEAKSDHAEGER